MTFFSNIMPQSDPLLTGEENFPVNGGFVPENYVMEIQKAFYGLNAYWNCLEKAQIAHRIIQHGTVVVGGLLVFDNDTSYGYHYNPPYEFHAWIRLGENLIFDPALPGVILKGKCTYDHIGPAIVNRKPVILNGIPEKWMVYDERFEYDKLLDSQFA